MSNFKSQAKRKRELAKLDKRQAKEQKRALLKAERSGTAIAAVPSIAASARPTPVHHNAAVSAPAVRKPLTLAEAAEQWRTTKIAKPKRR
jgi:hypothetical protein